MQKKVHFIYSYFDSRQMEWPICHEQWPIFPFTMGFLPCGSAGKESACNAGDLVSIPGFGRSPGEGKGYPLQYSGLENSMDWIVHGVAKSQTWLSNFHFPITMRVQWTFFPPSGRRYPWMSFSKCRATGQGWQLSVCLVLWDHAARWVSVVMPPTTALDWKRDSNQSSILQWWTNNILCIQTLSLDFPYFICVIMYCVYSICM